MRICVEDGTDAVEPPLGMMVEVPAAAMQADLFDADFYSIGSNDLIQYVMAAGRDIDSVAPVRSRASPAVEELIGRIVRRRAAGEGSRSACAATWPASPIWCRSCWRTGVRSFSVAPARLAADQGGDCRFGAEEVDHDGG